MATPAEKLAESLAQLEKLQNERGIAICQSISSQEFLPGHC